MVDNDEYTVFDLSSTEEYDSIVLLILKKSDSWLVLYDTGEIMLKVPYNSYKSGETVVSRATFKKKNGDFCALSYVWGRENTSDSMVKIPYTTWYDGGVRRKHEQRTWVDVIAHLGNKDTLEIVLKFMGENVYSRVHVQAVAFEMGSHI